MLVHPRDKKNEKIYISDVSIIIWNYNSISKR